MKGALEAAVRGLGLAQRFMQVEVVVARVDDAAGDVGAVVGGAFQIREQVGEDEARLDAALALLHSQDVARAHLLFERVDDLLERLDLRGDGRIMALEGLEREREDLADGGSDGGKLVFRAGGEGETLARHLLGGSEDVDGVVGDALKVADGL